MTSATTDSHHNSFHTSPSVSGRVYDLGSSEAGIPSSAIVHSIKRENTSHHFARSPKSTERAVILPWSGEYRVWWAFLVVLASFTAFFETYNIAFSPSGLAPYNDASSIIDYVLTAIFSLDILAHLNLAFYDENDEVVYNRKAIAGRYFNKMFWVDLLGVFPFYEVTLALTGQFGKDSRASQYLSLFRLFRLLRLHRVNHLFGMLQYNTSISLITLTLIRNFGAALVWAHVAACIFYFIARQYEFDVDNTWLGEKALELNELESYVTTLYWSIVTFTTVGVSSSLNIHLFMDSQ